MMMRRALTICLVALTAGLTPPVAADDAARGPVAGGVVDEGAPARPAPRTTTPDTRPPTGETPRDASPAQPRTDERTAGGDDSWRPEPGEEHILIDADEVYYHDGATVATGNVTVRHREMTITADEAEIDEDGVHGRFRGHVTIRTEEHEASAELIRVNFEDETWEVLGGATVLEPAFFEQGVVEPIYVSAEELSGSERDEVVIAHDGVATSCDLDRPHYGLYSDRIRIVGEQRLVLERPEVRILGTRVLRYPWNLVLSQRSRNNRFFPEFGENSVEGYYAKLAYLYLTGASANSYVRLHLTQKRGIGLGADHYYRLGPHAGEASVFYEPGQGALSGRARDEWEISDRLTSSLNLNLQSRSGYQSATESLAGNLTFRHRGEGSNTTLGIDSSHTDSAYSSSSRFTTSFTHRRQMGGSGSWDVRTVLRRSEYGESPARETLNADLQMRQRESWFDWAVAAEQEWYLEGGESRSYGVDRLPEIVLNTDSRRLGGFRLPGGIPLRARFNAGHFVQYPDEDRVSMAGLEMNLGGERRELGGDVTMTATGSFDQAFYDEGSARYQVGTSLNFDGEFGRRWFTRLSHRYAAHDGFSPLRSDYGSKLNDATLSVVRQSPDRSRVELTGGFDFVDSRWHELRLRGWTEATRRDRVELVSGYSLDRAQWRPIQVRWTHSQPRELYLALTSRYDLDGGGLSSADLQFDWPLDRRWRLQGVSTWSGYRDEFDQLNMRLTRDLHCWEASLSYNMELDELRLNLGIKAFPFEDRDWTLGRGGARLGSYQQAYY